MAVRWVPRPGRKLYLPILAGTHLADEVGASLSEQNAKQETTENEGKVRGAGQRVAAVQCCEGEDSINTQGLHVAGL